ncbi:MAG: polysaccharide biosynthesis C-terminal domain-containing protein [Thermoplasmata archaeon]|nr:polysaccharide biosynthesis C-terminal domain-containing protein [Thermoplasmata archaeon]
MIEKPDDKAVNKKKIFLIVSSFLIAIFNTVALLQIARNLGTEMLGALGFVLSFVGLFYFIGDMGNAFAFQTAVDRGFPLSRCYRHFMRTKLKLTLLLVVVSSLLLILFNSYLDDGSSRYLHVAVMIPMVGYFALNSLSGIWITGSVARGRQGAEKTYDFVDALIKVILIIGVINLGFIELGQMGVFTLSFIYLIASMVGLMVLINSTRKMKKAEEDDEIILVFSEISRKILPYMIFTSLMLNIDKLLIWHWWELGDLGLYFGAQRIVIFIGASSAAIGTIVGGAVVKYKGDDKKLAESLTLTERYITLLALPVTTFYIIFAHDLLSQFLGAGFAVAKDAVIILAVSGLFLALSTPPLLYLLRKRAYRFLGTITAMALGLNISLGLLLIPSDMIAPDMGIIHGINGAAIALLVSNAVAFFGYRFKVYSEIGFKPHPRILFHFLASGILFATIKFLIWLFDIEVLWYIILLFAILAAIIYFFLLYLGGEMLKEDFYRFRELVNSE